MRDQAERRAWQLERTGLLAVWRLLGVSLLGLLKRCWLWMGEKPPPDKFFRIAGFFQSRLSRGLALDLSNFGLDV